MAKTMRLDKFLSSQNICSRRDANTLTKKGRIKINGVLAAKADVKIDPECDTIEVDGVIIEYSKYLYIMMNKPQGVLSASNDKNAQTVIDLLPDDLRRRGLFPAGRLDKDTTGLMIITDDGDFAHRMLSPKSGIYKTYNAILDKPLSDDGQKSLESGVILNDGTAYKPAVIVFNKENDRSDVLIRITEGKFHEVKRMFQSVGCEVTALKRLSIGGLSLDEKLQAGECRLLTDAEKKSVFSHT